MANAVVGRVLLIPKGNYSEAATYNMLDLVRYNNKSWVCKQNSTGNTPAENTYWAELCADGIDGDDGESYYMYIRYSENSDGTDFVSAPTVDTVYIGFYTGNSNTAPADKALYTWSKYVGSGGGGTGAWGDITGKPFANVGTTGLKVTSGTVDVDFAKVAKKTSEYDSASSITDTDVLAGNGVKYLFSLIKSTLKTYFDTLYNKYVLPVASSTTLGGIKPDGTTITVDSDGVASAAGTGGGTTLYDPTTSPATELTSANLIDDIDDIVANTAANQVAGANAVKAVYSNLVYYDEDTDTLYINSTGSSYTYDSVNEILYVGGA